MSFSKFGKDRVQASPMANCVGTNQDFLLPNLAQNTESMIGAQRILEIFHLVCCHLPFLALPSLKMGRSKC